MRLAALLALLPTIAQPNCTTDAMLVFDGSTSMLETGSFTGVLPKIAEARQALSLVLPNVDGIRRVGLTTYGPPSGQEICDGVTLHFPPLDNASAAILSEIGSFNPSGLTPLTSAVSEAAQLMEYTSQPAVVVLLTDGNETCGGRPCATSQALAANAHDLTIHVIGFRLNAHDEYFRWNNPEQEWGEDNVARCFADATGGLYITADTIDELTAALMATLGCPIIGFAAPAMRQADLK